MTLHLKNIKTEFRVLAIDTCNRKRRIGVVYRGGLYLDGVLLLGHRAKSASQIGKDIRESKYFPELKILMLHDPSDTIEEETVEKETRLPLLTISTKKPRHNKSSQSFQSRRGRLWVETLLDTATVQRILDLTLTMGQLPEPVRVAHLLARSIRFSSVDKVKDKSRRGSQAC
jgi:endonuclease V-like protein UPF0215 family